MANIISSFKHQHAAHCESGVMMSLLNHQGLSLSEPMTFGLAGSIFFAYVPLIKFGNLPLLAYRMYPGHLIQNVTSRLGIRYHNQKYWDTESGHEKAMKDLILQLEKNQPCGILTSPYFLPYFTPEMRFQFNAHNVIVYGYENNEFYLSDPVFDHPVKISYQDLKKARFPKGLGAPKGFIHYPLHIPSSFDLPSIIKKSIRKTAFLMLKTPLPCVGTRGIFYVARLIRKLPEKKGALYTRQFLGNMVRMQEEIGTGGAGFRYLYAAFLQEAAKTLSSNFLHELSKEVTQTGDLWREYALLCATEVKDRKRDPRVQEVAHKLEECGQREKKIFETLYTHPL